MPRAVRATIIQPDKHVPVDRFGQWLSSNRVLLRAVPLWQREVPDVDSLGDGLLILGGTMSAHDQATHEWIEPLKELMVAAVDAGIPTLAICLGHQLLAEAFGGTVTVGHPAGGEHGAFPVTWHEGAIDDPLLGTPRRAGHIAGRRVPPRHRHRASAGQPRSSPARRSTPTRPSGWVPPSACSSTPRPRRN